MTKATQRRRLAVAMRMLVLLSLGAMVGLPLPGSGVAIAQTTPPQPAAEAERLWQQGVQQFQADQFAAARQSWQAALLLYRIAKDRRGEAKVLSGLGLAAEGLDNYTEAIAYYRQSLAIAREFKNQSAQGTVLERLGIASHGLGNYAEAIAYYQQSLAIARERKDRRAEGNVLTRLGSVYNDLGNYPEAIRYHEQSLAIARELKNRSGEGAALGNLGNVYLNLGNYPTAIQYYEQRLIISRELKDRQGERIVLGALGAAYKGLANYPRAIQYHEQSLAIAREIQDRRGVSAALANLGSIYQALGNNLEAIRYQEQSLAIARQLKDRRGEGAALGNLGVAYETLGKYAEAIQYQQQRLALSREIQDRQGQGNALGNLGNIYTALGKYAEAINYQQQRLTIVREIQDKGAEGQTLMNLGNVYLMMENFAEAIQFYEQGLAIARETQDRYGAGFGLNSLGVALFRSDRLAEAEGRLLEAIQLREALRQGLQDSQKISLADTQSNVYNNLQRVLLAQSKVGAALEIAERSRARAFVELLAQRTQEQGQTNPLPIQIEAIKQIAQARRVTLVEYANLYNEQLIIYVVKPTGEVTARQVDLQPLKQQNTSLDNLIAAARCLGVRNCETSVVSRGRQPIAYNGVEGDRQFNPIPTPLINNAYLQQLHQLLIEPIADLLPTDPEAPIVFLPQGRMFLLPFALLQDGQGQYLIEKHTLAIAPSIQVLELARQQRQQGTPGKGLLVVGNPVMPPVVYRPGEPPGTLIPLPGSEREAQAIAQLLNVPALIGKQATETAVRRLLPAARLIHLATHGLLDDLGQTGVPGAIALAADGVNDGLLTANEMLAPNFKLKADLVVLSACDTGKGKITGDGVVGLSRALITAGASSVMVSLWAVPDAPTADLMTQFYQNLNQGQGKAQALRQAMLATKKTHPDPLAWAAFTLIGDLE